MNKQRAEIALKDLTEELGNVQFNESMVFQMVKH